MDQEGSVDDANKETLTERLVERAKEAAGLPPGKPAEERLLPERDDSPRHTLTSDDAEGLPPHNDVGPGLRKI
jgi:hypothetical protein